jgi:Patatin-like phospholipase
MGLIMSSRRTDAPERDLSSLAIARSRDSRERQEGASASSTMTGVLILTLAMLLGACSTTDRETTREDLERVAAAFHEAQANAIREIHDRSGRRIRMEYRDRARAPQSHDVLILSGGGPEGAFGAGFLDGWGKVRDPEYRRPRFDTVGGISTGALLAPFAFVGTAEAYASVAHEYATAGGELTESRGILPYWPSNLSLYTTDGLEKRIRRLLSPEVVRAIAEGGREGRQLLIGATSLDLGAPCVWDLAREAIRQRNGEASADLASVLLASSAVPGAFPPVDIGGMRYVDGGVSMQFLSGMDDRSWIYQPDAGDDAGLGIVDPECPLRIRIWVIINQSLVPEPKVVESSWIDILDRSLATIVRRSVVESLQDLETFMRLVDRQAELDVQFRYVSIPPGIDLGDSEEIFDPEVMSRLVDLGREMGADPTSWNSRALLPSFPRVAHRD